MLLTGSIETTFILLAVLLVLSVVASQLSSRLGIPALLIFLAVGMLAGSDGLGGIYFDDPRLAQDIGITALVVILFQGGLETEWRAVRDVLWPGLSLATVGVLLTALIFGAAAHLILGLSFTEGILLGAITSSTDAAAVFSLLNASGVSLRKRLRSLLELESGINDPMAVFLTVGLIQLLQNPGQAVLSLVPLFIQQMALGALAGCLIGRVLLFLINRLRLGYTGLYPVLVFGMLLLTYGATALVGGSGFLAVYLVGLILGRAEFLHKRGLARFFDGLAWLMQIVMFLTLGLLVFPSQVMPVVAPGLLLAAVLIGLARPVGVVIGLALSRFSWREKAFLSWVGLRGAVPIILATYPQLAGIPNAGLFFNVIFFVVISSVLVQGTTIPRAARLLGVEEAAEPGIALIPEESRQGLREMLQELRVPANSWAVGRAIYELGLPEDFLIVLIGRDDQWIVPNGSVVLHGEDRLLGVASPADHNQARAVLERTAEG